MTEERKREDEILFEKRTVKELEAEEAEFAGSEKFVTSAYKRQLQATQKWAAEKALEDAKIMADDVRKKDGISDFYTNMLKGKNKATGATVRGASPPKENPSKGIPPNRAGRACRACRVSPIPPAPTKPKPSSEIPSLCHTHLRALSPPRSTLPRSSALRPPSLASMPSIWH